MSAARADFVVIGGGIVGLATARELLLREPSRRVVLIEKEDAVGRHQSGHNSGVLHTGIYYKPGSLKATTCRAGKQLMESYCREEGIEYAITGKVIVATDDEQLPLLRTLLDRGIANGVQCEWIGSERLAELEPHARGVGAIHVREAGMVDYRRVCDALLKNVAAAGGDVRTSHRVVGIHDGKGSIVVQTDGTAREEVDAAYVINCAGLYSDRVAAMGSGRSDVRIVPFRGEYYRLRPEFTHLCRSAIYPVADPRFPFLGVHCTRRIDGSVECGPNAVLAFAREGYGKTTINLGDLAETLSFRGFRRLARRYWKTGIGEMWRSMSKAGFVRALQRLVPEITADALEPAPSGVRAQAVTPDGALADDFVLVDAPRRLNVVNAPSPAATASLAIAKIIADRACAAA